MLKELTEITDKELKESRRTISHQKKQKQKPKQNTTNKETEIIQRNQIETLELKSIKAEMKYSLERKNQ